jgi:hypothetical protein
MSIIISNYDKTTMYIKKHHMFKLINIPINNSIKTIIFENFNDKLDDINFRALKSLECIFFNDIYNQPIDNITFPKNLNKLYFGNYFNQPIDNLQINSLKELIFGNSFNQPIKHLQINSLKELTFGDSFNQPIDHLQINSLEKLSFGNSFNQPINSLHLNSLEELTFGNNYNQPIDHLEFTSLKTISLTLNYNCKYINLIKKHINVIIDEINIGEIALLLINKADYAFLLKYIINTLQQYEKEHEDYYNESLNYYDDFDDSKIKTLFLNENNDDIHIIIKRYIILLKNYNDSCRYYYDDILDKNFGM